MQLLFVIYYYLLFIEAQTPFFRKVKCRFEQGKGRGNYTSVSYLEFPSLPSPDNVLLQTLSPLPPTAPGPGVVGASSDSAIPTWVHFPSSALQLVLRVPCTPSSVPHYPWEEDEESEDIVLCVFPQLEQRAQSGSFLEKRDYFSVYLRSTLGAAGVPVEKVTLFFLSDDASQGSMCYSCNPIQFYPWESLERAFQFTRTKSTIYQPSFEQSGRPLHTKSVALWEVGY